MSLFNADQVANSDAKDQTPQIYHCLAQFGCDREHFENGIHTFILS